jgi:hypothetical protein
MVDNIRFGQNGCQVMIAQDNTSDNMNHCAQGGYAAYPETFAGIKLSCTL